MSIKLITSELDGKLIGYCNETEFLIQLGHGKGAYKTKHVIKGNLGQAVMIYNGYNVGNGYKKRLVMPSSKKPILARARS